jgi:NAD-dependent deacetylase
MEHLKRILKSAKRICILTGAGVSSESGIPTFRGKDGLWNKYNPSELATFEAFEEDPIKIWQWYLWRMWLISRTKPNKAHTSIAKMENLFESFLLVTQNVDGLHKAAGSKKLIELHGNIFEGKCRYCGKSYSEDEFREIFPYSNRNYLKDLPENEFKESIIENLEENELPICSVCGEIIGPGVVWFGEMIPEDRLSKAFNFAETCNVFFSIGTSSVVQPAASLPLIAKRHKATLIEINTEETPISNYCDFTFKDSASNVLPQIVKVIS